MAAGSASAVTGTDWFLGNQQAGFQARADHTSVVFNDRMWIIGGTNSATIRNDTWSSADGVIWTLVNGSAEFPKRTDAASVVFNNRMWVIGGSSGAAGLNDTWSSPDGNIWTLTNASAEFPARSLHTATVYDNKMWVIGGWTSEFKNDTWSSPDGNIWTLTNASVEFPARSRHTTVVFNNLLWTIGGFDGTYLNDTWKSGDGNVWTVINASPAFPGRSDHTTTVFNGNMWVTGGQDSGKKRNDTWYSSDGNIWILANASPAFPARYSHTSVVLGNRMWVLGGSDPAGNYYNDTWYTDSPSTPVVPIQLDSGSGETTVQSSVKGISHAGEPVTFTFGKALSPTNPVRIESVTVIPAQSVTGEILCLVKDASRDNHPMPTGLNVAGLAEIDMVWIREDAIREGTVSFSIDRNWLEGNKITPASIVMLRFADGKWNELSTTFNREDQGRDYFTVSLPGFSVFAIAAKSSNQTLSQSNLSPTASPTLLTVTTGTPAARLTTVTYVVPTHPQPSPTTLVIPAPEGPVPDRGISFDLILVTVAVILMGIIGFLVRRWWIHRQNPALFRK
ncbi:MAG: PGF-pre-PGF domain-containing protein [Methanoregula sp.]